ncbi:MAG TPA: glutamine amidotransferase [Myxococcota bacterium]|nr:glutamine amidotransferase [Myxococcota bacterium]
MAVRDWALVFEWTSPWRIVMLGALAACAFFLAWQGLRGSSPGRRRLLLVLRGLNLALIAAMLLGPAIEHRMLKPLKSRIALLLDSSASMSIDDGGSSRRQRLLDFLADHAGEIDRLGKDYSLQMYSFADKLIPADPGRLKADGESTDISAALASLADNADGQAGQLASVIVISDGADTGRLGSMHTAGDLPSLVGKLLDALGCPVNTLAVGRRERFADLSVGEVVSDDFAFVRNAVEIEARLSSDGLDEVSVPVTLEQAGRSLATKVVSVPRNGSRKVKLRFVPDDVGKFVYRITTPSLDGETISSNNDATFVMRIIRDKIRVLHVVGRPGWDQRFLREVLKRNPNIDLVSFYILRTVIDAPGVSEQELSLIPFPIHKLFGSELNTFDVLIFQNFNHGPYSVGFYLPQIADYVRGGGAFWMIGGDLSFGSGGYGGSALEQILPVGLSAAGDLQADQVRSVLTEAGARHPVLDLGDPGLWERLPSPGAYNKARSIQPGAEVLLAHPFERSGGERAPILALREVGRGRSAALLTDGSWRWRFQLAGSDASRRPYQRFINNLLRWLIRDPDFDPLILRSIKARYMPGENVSLRLQAHGAPGAKARLTLQAGGRVIERRPVQLDDQGSARIELPSSEAGAYVAAASVEHEGSTIQASDAFVVEDTGIEHARPFPRPDLLRKISRATGGSFAAVEDGSLSDIKVSEHKRFRVESSTTRPLLASWWVLLTLVILLSAEWWTRRRWGFS